MEWDKFAEALRRCPVHQMSTAEIQGTDPRLLFGFEPGHPTAAVLGYDAVSGALRDRTGFGQGGYGPNLERVLGHTVLSMEGEEHRRYRGLIQEALHKREMARWEKEYVEPTVNEAIDSFASRGHADLVNELALAVAPRVITRAMALPADDFGRFVAWGRAMLNYVHDPVAGRCRRAGARFPLSHKAPRCVRPVLGGFMPATPQTEAERVVTEFLHSMGPTWKEFLEGYDRWLADDALWENSGFPAVKGKANAIKFLHKLRDLTGMQYCTIDVYNICSLGDVVLTERTDRMHAEDGTVIIEFPIMGTFEVRDRKIARYSDYFADSELRRLIPSL